MDACEIEPTREPAMAALLADAFVDDPFVSWFYPNVATRHAKFRHLMSRLLGATRPYNRVLRTATDGACALWIPPGRSALSAWAACRMIPAVPSFAGMTARTLTALQNLDRHHPNKPHWYLFVVGSAPDRRGQGHGRAVIDPVLSDCDRAGLPAYLESSNPDNIPYYERFGFRVRGELTSAGAPPLTAMWREPA
jgi:ribosomal protein S18 acetylase RimI-like enzyme